MLAKASQTVWCLRRALRETREHTRWLFGKKIIPGRGNSKYKGPGAGVYLGYLENSQEEMVGVRRQESSGI